MYQLMIKYQYINYFPMHELSVSIGYTHPSTHTPHTHPHPPTHPHPHYPTSLQSYHHQPMRIRWKTRS